MSRSDLELRLVRWLDEGPAGAPTAVVEAALKVARAERQVRVFSMPWPQPRRLALPGSRAWGQAAIGAAAVVIAAVLLVWSFNNGPIPPASSSSPTVSAGPSPSPSPSLSASPSPSPTPGPSLTSPPSPTNTPQSSSTAPPPPPATGPASGWPPSVLAGAGEFDAVAMAADRQGAVHIAAAITVGVGVSRGIMYMTNSGGWHTERVTTAPKGQDDEGYDGEPDIAVDADGTVWIVFARYQCAGCTPTLSDGVFVTNNAGGIWSEPEQIGDAQAYGPSVAVRDGTVHVVYASGQMPAQSYPGFYATNGSGNWSTLKLDDKASLPRIVVTSGGQALVAYATASGVTLKTIDGLDSQAFTDVPGPGPVDDLFLAIDPSDVLHVVWIDQASKWHEVVNDPIADAWSAPADLDFGQLRPDAIAVDVGDTGVVASARSYQVDTGGAWFSIARLGPANADQLAQGDVAATDVAAFAGKFHVSYAYAGDGTAHGVWYTNSSTE